MFCGAVLGALGKVGGLVSKSRTFAQGQSRIVNIDYYKLLDTLCNTNIHTRRWDEAGFRLFKQR